MNLIDRFFLLLFSLAMLLVSGQSTAGTFSLRMDNDFVFGSDRGYTGGIQFGWIYDRHQLKEKDVYPWEFWLSDDFSDFSVQNQWSFGYQLYTFQTAENGYTNSLFDTGVAALTLRRHYASPRDLYNLEFSVGWGGPAVRGEEVHNAIHRLIGNEPYDGWQQQGPDQPLVSLGFEKIKFINRDLNSDLKIFYSVSGNLGNLLSNTSAHLSALYQQNTDVKIVFNQVNQVSSRSNGLGWFLYWSIGPNYRFYSSFADGRPFTEDAGVDEFHQVVFEAVSGIGLTYQNMSLSMGGNTWSPFYNHQPGHRFRFATMMLNIDF